MSRIILCASILCVLFTNTVSAQLKPPHPLNKKESINFKDRIKAEPAITAYSLNQQRGTPDFISFNQQLAFNTKQASQLLEKFLPLRKNLDELKLQKEDLTYADLNVQRYQQYFHGIKVEHGNYIVTSKNNKISFMSGEFYAMDPDQRIVPQITAETAFAKAIQSVGASTYIWQTADSVTIDGKIPTAELVFVDNALNVKGQRLAYKFNVYAVNPLSRAKIYVDALDGEIILKDAIIKDITTGKVQPEISIPGPLASSKKELDLKSLNLFANTNAVADTRYTGTRNIVTDQVSANLYRLREKDRTAGANNMGSFVETYNCKSVATYTSAVDFTDADNNWTAAEYNNAAKDNAALDAHWGAEKVIDYWWNVHGRKSIDNKGFGIKSFVHYGNAFNNAYWNGTAMTYGDGSGTGAGGFDVLTSLDVCGHEIGHGVCSFTADLVYQDESGAMNEGFSDIWAACIENYTTGTGDVPVGDNKDPFKIGEEIVASAAQPLRSMSNPNTTSTYGRQPDTYQGTYWYTGTADNGGVHTNSGVLNHWFYVLVQGESGTNDVPSTYNVTGIGWAKAEQIAYVTELNLTANATYATCRTASINAVIALFGRCSAEHIAVTNAWYAVGVGAAFGGCTTTSTVQFAISADNANEGSGKDNCSYPAGIVPSYTMNALLTLSNPSSATENTVATITLAGTALQGKDYTINPSTLTWAPGTSGPKEITITIIDDNNSEAAETIVLGYTLNTNGGSAVAGSLNQTETITIADNDTTASTYSHDAVIGDYDTYSTSTNNVSLFRGSTSRKKIQYLYKASELQVAGLRAGYISHLFLYNVGTATTTTFTNLNIQLGTTPATNLNTAFAAFATISTVYNANYTTSTTEDFFDFPLASPLYWDGVSNILVQACYDGSSGTTNYLTAVSATGTTNYATRYLTATSGGSLCGSTGGTAASTRADIVLGMYNGIQTVSNLSRSAYLGPNADVSFYSATDGKLMARIVNGSSFDYGCTQVVIDRDGTGGSTFWNSGAANQLTNKSYRVLPTTDNPIGNYSISLYYTKAEHDGWEAVTGKDWEAAAKIVKVKGHDINEVSPSTPALFSSVDIPVAATRNSFGDDYEIIADFSSGFSGFAAGDPAMAPLPIKLLSFTGTKNNGTSVLNWSTSFEFNNNYFEVEVSTDGINYHKIGAVNSFGNSDQQQHYKFVDNLPSNGVNYYRLKQVDKDGHFTYSNIITLNFNFDKLMSVYPNPAKDLLTITLDRPAVGTLLNIYAADGKLVYSVTEKNISRSYQLDISNLVAGVYLIKATVNGEKLTQRFLKK